MRALVIALVLSSAAGAQLALVERATEPRLANASTDDRIRAYEKDPRQRIELVSAYLQKVRESGDFSYLDRATKIVDGILEKDSASEAALRFQNEIDLQWHRFPLVADRAEDMIKFNRSDPGLYANLGDALMEMGQYDRAGAAYTRMFSLRPNLASYNRLAYHRFVTGDPDAAIGLMREAVEAGGPVPENTAWCMAELGDMYFKTGHLSEARQVYEDALQLFPTLHRALAGLGNVQAATGHLPEAIRSYEHAQAIVPKVEYAAALEDLYAAAGLKTKAAQQEQMVDAIERLGRATGEKANRNLALILADHDRNLGRAVELVEAEKEVRGDVYTWDAIAWVMFKSNRYSEASEASRRALQLSTPEPSFYYHAGMIASALSGKDAARPYFEKMKQLNPRFSLHKFGTVASAR